MTPPRDVLWDQDQHTAEKLNILRYYLDAWWTIILSSHFDGATYVDAFSGPGEYRGGEDGSPAVSLRALLGHRDKAWWGRKHARLVMLDQDRDRVEWLNTVLHDRFGSLPPSVEVHIDQGTCGEHLLPVLGQTGSWGQPIFAFLDPYGVDVPLEVIKRIGRNRNSEVFVTFMSRWLTRFAKLEELEQGDRLFGDRGWRRVTEQPTDQKRRWLVDLYRERLREAGFKFRMAFELVDEGGREFFLIHGTSSAQGLRRMKEAMWKVDPVRGVRFQDPRDPNQIRFDIGAKDPDLQVLERMLTEKLADGTPASVDALRQWALLDTVFLEHHVPMVLRKWRDLYKDEPVLDVQPPRGRISRNKTVRLLRPPPVRPVHKTGVTDLAPGD